MTLLLSLALKGAVVLLVAALAVRLLRRAPASLQHGVWAAAFGALLLLPILEAVGPRWDVEVLPTETAHAPTVVRVATPLAPIAPVAPPAPALLERDARAFEAEARAFEREVEAFAAEMQAFEREVSAAVAPAPPRPAARLQQGRARSSYSPLARLVGSLWIAGVIVVALGWLGAAAAARRIVAQARPEVDEDWAVLTDRARRLSGLDDPVRLLRTDALDVPIAWGYGSPAVVLPVTADDWSEERREAVLLHEMAHLRRRDAWTQLVAQAAVTVHWFNPLAWWGYRQHLDAREQACDDAVLQGGARPSAYAAHLVGVARALRQRPAALAAVAPMARRAPIETRILSILDADRRRGRCGRLGQVGTVALGACVLIPLAAFYPVADQAPAAKTVALAAAPEAPAPPAPPVPPSLEARPEPLAVSDDRALAATAPEIRLDTLDKVRAQIRRAQADARRALEVSVGVDAEIARSRLDALDSVEFALAEVNAESLRATALRAIREARLDRKDHLADLAEARVDAIEARLAHEEARADAQESMDDAIRDALEDALDDALDALETIDVHVDVDRAQSARQSARASSAAATQALQRARAPRPSPGPSPRPSPRPTPRPEVRADVVFDWDAVDRARRDAVRNATSDRY